MGGTTEQGYSSGQKSGHLERRIDLVTGASRGIGRAAALALARQGDLIVGAARAMSRFGRLNEEIVQAGGDCWLCACELAESIEIQNLIARIATRYGRFDGLFMNA